MSDGEKTPFGATIERPAGPDLVSPPSGHLSTILERNSKSSTDMLAASPEISRPSTAGTMSRSPVSPAASGEHNPENPFSAFYEHPPARRSAETPRPSLQVPKRAYDYDPEKGGFDVSISQQSSASNLKLSVEVTKECAMWPSQKTLKEQHKAQKRKERMCSCWGKLDRRQKIILQVLIALLIVGAAVGIGVGISRAVGGGVWTGQGQTKQLTDHDG